MSPILEMLHGSLQEAREYPEQEDCWSWIGSKIKKNEQTLNDKEYLVREAKNLINVNVLPHIGTSDKSLDRKAYFLGYMVHRLLNASLGKTD
jgi:DNA-directed RNA polymerase II subunit RPB2